ncbi:hypothetical protein RPIT_12820 [Tessaracoccus flavus]|uniref:Aldose 1-epimerase n=2 Tax=Tessaracoccus flavus TaxID=1610493 RepID=A0A1Q2CJ62_9ACTN|nr:hypothetical protein RPIT_12820 [Tessaracoccus flavus]
MVTAAFEAGGGFVSPLYEAPWLGQWQGDPLLAHLRGDFVCVPFGMPGHGYAANHAWELLDVSDERAVLSIAYPEDHPVERVTREVVCADGALEFADSIEMREPASLPLGLHPMFRLPDGVGEARLVLPDAAAILTPPQPPEPTARLLPGQRFIDPTRAPSVDGTADLTRLPWEGRSEDLAQLVDVVEGRVGLVVDGVTTVLEWDQTVLKHCLLWVSNRGRDYPPWNGRNLCLGVEPVTSAFDLGAEASAGRNPVADEGVQTAVSLEPGETHVVHHRVSVTAS